MIGCCAPAIFAFLMRKNVQKARSDCRETHFNYKNERFGFTEAYHSLLAGRASSRFGAMRLYSVLTVALLSRRSRVDTSPNPTKISYFHFRKHVFILPQYILLKTKIYQLTYIFHSDDQPIVLRCIEKALLTTYKEWLRFQLLAYQRLYERHL